MAQPYVPLWMSSNDALDHVMKATDCDEASAFAQLQQNVRDGDVDGRERGPDADRRRALHEARGFLPDETAWRIWFIGLTVPSAKTREIIETCEFRRETVLSAWPHSDVAPKSDRDRPQDGTPADAPETSPSRLRNSGGRPRKWDWDAFTKELLRLANTPDGLPDRAGTTKHMAEWCVREWGDEPSDSTLRDRIARLYPDAP